MHVLLVLEERTVERWDDDFLVRTSQRFDRDIFRQQQLQPVEQFRGRRLLLQTRNLAQIEKYLQCLLQQRFFQTRKVNVDDPCHRLLVGELDVMEETAAQERVG